LTNKWERGLFNYIMPLKTQWWSRGGGTRHGM
jgi:hypothetical protein